MGRKSNFLCFFFFFSEWMPVAFAKPLTSVHAFKVPVKLPVQRAGLEGEIDNLKYLVFWWNSVAAEFMVLRGAIRLWKMWPQII